MEKVIKGWPDYLVSDKGFVVSRKYGKRRILKPDLRGGYPCVTLCGSEGQWRQSVHRLVAQAFVPNRVNLPQVNHKNGDKSDSRAANLEWCTPSQNVRHSVAELGNQISVVEFSCPKGARVKVSNIRQFCRDNDLQPSHMCEVLSGERKQHKGWTR